MKKSTKRISNLTRFGELIDKADGGEMLFTDNLAQALEYLLKKQMLSDKKMKVRVIVSLVNEKEIRRYSESKVIEVLDLLREWKFSNHEEFSLKSLAKYKQESEWKLEVLQRQGQKDHAFAQYGQYVRVQNYIREKKELENKIQNLSIKDQEKERGKFENKRLSGASMIIG